ncbi:hypothetical protein J7T55_000400 [Diaporthe amygdali]|uniref:uncharacterized protein n=1 Tax=Phomopsis amygdali TaxID=1214568 RepID=UPI0022FF0B2F|nr:uncharacterized protein J7T55_000400 [Diaporthe amygdali]KAJ0109475.1 hypothetical protein J7T55_000400 [Diaporthe amygdali]
MDRIRNFFDDVSAFFHSPLFNPDFKNKMHLIQVTLVITMIILTGARVGIKPSGMPVTRSDTLGIVMGIKTLVILSYQLATTHFTKFRRWRSLKAYQILNTMEILFWFVVVIITFMGISRYCQNAYCGLSWLIVLIAVILTRMIHNDE